jgi:hypothetical protein
MSSGTPLILAVKAIEPAAIADIGLPDGAKITDRLSTMSTYSSFDVCRTLDLRHGIAGPLLGAGGGCNFDAKLLEDDNAVEELEIELVSFLDEWSYRCNNIPRQSDL